MKKSNWVWVIVGVIVIIALIVISWPKTIKYDAPKDTSNSPIVREENVLKPCEPPFGEGEYEKCFPDTNGKESKL